MTDPCFFFNCCFHNTSNAVRGRPGECASPSLHFAFWVGKWRFESGSAGRAHTRVTQLGKVPEMSSRPAVRAPGLSCAGRLGHGGASDLYIEASRTHPKCLSPFSKPRGCPSKEVHFHFVFPGLVDESLVAILKPVTKVYWTERMPEGP